MAVAAVEPMTLDQEQMEALAVAVWVVGQPVLEIHRQHLHHKEIMAESEILFLQAIQPVLAVVGQMR
jgi:hypothetical protein